MNINENEIKHTVKSITKVNGGVENQNRLLGIQSKREHNKTERDMCVRVECANNVMERKFETRSNDEIDGLNERERDGEGSS